MPDESAVKAHRGMAHVPRRGGTRRRPTRPITPRGQRRRVSRGSRSFADRFRGFRGSMSSLRNRFRNRRRRRPTAPMAAAPVQAPTPIQAPRPIKEPTRIQPNIPKPIQSDAGGGRGGATTYRRGAAAPQTPQGIQAAPTPIAEPRIIYNGGYISRAKYGQVNNLKSKK